MVCSIVKFLLFFLMGIVFCTIAWGEWVGGKIYTCTDRIYFDFLLPGDWYHGPMVGDTIQPGWSEGKLLALWLVLVLSTVFFSIVLTMLTMRTD